MVPDLSKAISREASHHFARGQDPSSNQNLQLTMAAMKKLVVRLFCMDDQPDAQDKDMHVYFGLWELELPEWKQEDRVVLETLLKENDVKDLDDKAHFAMWEKPHLRFPLKAIPMKYEAKEEWKMLEVDRATRILIGKDMEKGGKQNQSKWWLLGMTIEFWKKMSSEIGLQQEIGRT